MALQSCRECGHEISDKAAFCPSCGASRLTDADGWKIGWVVAFGAIIFPIGLALFVMWSFIELIMGW